MPAREAARLPAGTLKESDDNSHGAATSRTACKRNLAAQPTEVNKIRPKSLMQLGEVCRSRPAGLPPGRNCEASGERAPTNSLV